MPQIVAIGYIAITVSDLEATCTFYDVADQGYVIDRLA